VSKDSAWRDAAVLWRMGDPGDAAGEKPSTALRSVRFATEAMTLCVRMRATAADAAGSVLLAQDTGNEPVFQMFFGEVGSVRSLAFELWMEKSEAPVRVSIPAALIRPTECHDVVIRYNGAKLQLFVDGALLDEEFPVGAMRRGAATCLIGEGLRGLVDHAAVWNRAVTDEEIVALSGGVAAVAQRMKALTNYAAPSLQYWRPSFNANVGDCLPFFHDGKFHFVYLLDWGHHSRKGGKGAHQWAQAISADLVHWEHQPLLVPITDQREGSICTGSLFFHDGVYYAWYATRFPEHPEALSLATSADGIHFTKMEPNPFAVPQPGYDPRAYRDPHVFRDPETGLFHLIVTAMRSDPAVPPDQRGALAHLVSRDLKSWELTDPLLQGLKHAPECPDYFFWKGWYYLICSQGGQAIYRMSRRPLGPWEKPKVDLLANPLARVMKTAAFTGDRRMGAAFLPTSEGNKDGGRYRYAGRAYLVELVQNPDGTLGSKFVPEMIPKTGEPVKFVLNALNKGSVTGNSIRLNGGTAMRGGVPDDARITLRVSPQEGASRFGLRLRAADAEQRGYELTFTPAEQKVQLLSQSLMGVEGLDQPLDLDIVLKGEVIDVCIADRRTFVHRVYDLHGDKIIFSAEGGEVSFESVQIRPLICDG